MGVYQKIAKSQSAKYIKEIANSNFVAKILAIIIIWSFVLIPTWIYIFSRILINPVGFWQELALFGIFAIVVGWLQALLIIIGGALTFTLIVEGI